ncbi:MAG: rhodanese-like domain-containing protein [Planctomycetota bacterium]
MTETPDDNRSRLGLMAQMGLLLVAGTLLGFGFNPEGLRPRKPPHRNKDSISSIYRAPDVELAEFRQMLESGRCMVVDARSGHDFVNGHIPGALAVRDRDSNDLTRIVRNWLPHSGPVIVVDSHPLDFRARRKAADFRLAGVQGARALQGGMEAWRKAGLPLVVGWDMDVVIKASRR